MSWWWMGLALAGPVGTDDPAPWVARAEVVLDGPPGCYEVVGRATWSHDLGRWGSTRGDAIFAARLQDGVWGAMRIWPLGELGEEDRVPVYGEAVRFTPMVGRVRRLAVRLDEDRDLVVDRSTDARIAPVNTLRDVIDQTSDAVAMEWTRWDEARGGLELVRTTTAGSGGTPLELRTFFPGGEALPALTTLSAGRYRPSTFSLVRVDDLEVTIRARAEGERVLPEAERLRFTLRLPGVRVEAAQRIAYRSVAPCAEDP